MDPFLGQIVGFGGNFAPRGWAFCAGQLLPISQYSALFSLLGTMYGGDGRTTFGLPDLRGRVMINHGHGPGLTTYSVGNRGGTEFVTLNQSEMPSHSHSATLHGESTLGTSNNPQGRMLANSNTAGPIYGDVIAADDKTMASQSIRVNNAGGNLAHENRMPYLAVSMIIALQGVFPSRS